MTQSFKFIVSAFSLLFISPISTQVSANEYRHIDQLALKIQRNSKRLLRETKHYRHSSGYRHLVADTQSLYRLAGHIHEVAHFEGNFNHLQRDVRQLDREFHHLESVFERIEHDAIYDIGHIHGNTAHVKRLLNSIEDSIHHLAEDVATIRRRMNRRRPVCDAPIHIQPIRRPVPGHGHGYGYGYRGGRTSYGHGIGISIGGGSSQFQFRF